MTDAEWVVCTNPTLMLEFLKGKPCGRKLRLFACACCRLVWHLLVDERSRGAVEAAERLADGLIADGEAQAAFAAACDASIAVRRSPDASPETMLRLRRQPAPDKVRRAVYKAAFAVGHGVEDVQAHIRGSKSDLVDGPMRSRLLRDIFGPLPFRPVAIAPGWYSWNDGTIPKLAEAIYQERVFDSLPVLADALEEAGCTDAEILSHLRGPGPHTRGCWPLDLILGKS